MQPTILVVDDSSVERCLASSLLAEKSDYRILFAEDGRKALEVLRRSTIDLVVTDLVMPVMDGLELADRGILRFHRRVPDRDDPLGVAPARRRPRRNRTSWSFGVTTSGRGISATTTVA